MAHSPDYDFIGFTFGEKWFKDINVLHVSDGSRYNDNLAPTMQDKTVQVPGGHGTYYFGSYYTQRTFSVQIAYDSITEEDIRTLRQMTNWGVQKLTFDEQPYKTYMAKMTGTPQLKYICFDDGETDRVYKGEGTLQFTCFYPFAICEHKWLDDSWYSNFGNKDEWKVSAGLLNNAGGETPIYDHVDSQGKVLAFNPGDLPTDFKIYYDIANVSATFTVSCTEGTLNINGIPEGKTCGNNIRDEQICINTKNHLIEGYRNNEPTGNLYNEYIVSGDFFKIPVTATTAGITINVGNANTIEYNYLYL